MPADWDRSGVSALQEADILLVEDGNHGEYRPRPREFGEGRTAFIRAADIESGRVLFESAQRINETALARIRKGIGRGGDVLFSHKGTVGKLAATPLDSPPFVCSPQTTFWRSLKPSQLDRRFLYYFMCSPVFKNQWRARKGETDMADYVSLTAQRQFWVPLPPAQEQRAIGSILGALDDKIEVNRQVNRTLAAMAQAIFKSWFVDFDPVVAKMAGRKPFAMNDEIAAFFPDRFAESELGLIPEGWDASRIGEKVKVVGGSTPRTNEPRFWDGGTISWITPRDLAKLQDYVVLNTERRITPEGLSQISSGLLPVGTVLLSSRAPIGYLAIAEVPLAINQGFIAMICDGNLPNHYVFHWTRENMEEIVSRAGGTTFAEISKSGFRPIPVLVPDRKVIAAFQVFSEPLHQQIVANRRQSSALAEMRDLLLPKLLSGEVRVTEAETLVGVANP
jgi:type I restriction enzyme, S subunit